MNKIATVKGYTAQARYYAQNMALVGGVDSEWKSAGWIKLDNGAVKPVFTLVDGRNVVIMDGGNHLTVVVYEAPADKIKATEEECW